jgi:hypothetical protein
MYPAPESRCSQAVPQIYVWVGTSAEKSDIEAAAEALMAAIEEPGRLWNMWNRASTKAEFAGRLRAAQRGELKPIDEVKYLERGSQAWLYEIRWQDISVRHRTPEGVLSFLSLKVRALHAETSSLPMHLIGLHAHEKIIVDVEGDPEASRAETARAQNREIDKAVKRFWDEQPSNWGIV